MTLKKKIPDIVPQWPEKITVLFLVFVVIRDKRAVAYDALYLFRTIVILNKKYTAMGQMVA